MKSRNAQGVGIPNPKDAITVTKENILWEKGILGFKDPNTLCNTVLFGSFGNDPMQSCSVHHVSLSSVSSVLASVYSPPSDRFDHRSVISYKYMQLCP